MKKGVKIALGIVIVIVVAAAIFYSSNKPISAEVYKIEEKNVSMYFIETGEVAAARDYQIFAVNAGEIAEVPVAEGDYVEAGQPICLFDTEAIAIKVLEASAQISASEAQSASLSTSEQKEKDSLSTTRNDLRAQLEALNAQQNSSNATKEEQIKLQQQIISAYQENLKFAQDKSASVAAVHVQLAAQYETQLAELDKYAALLAAGAISQQQYDNVKNAADAAKIPNGRRRGGAGR